MFHVTSTALHLFGLTIHWYGLIIALGIILGVILAMSREKKLGLPKETTLDIALIGVPAAIICARLYFVIFSWDLYADDPISALYIWEGGMAIYGGIIGAMIAGWIYARIKKIPFLRLADLAAPSFALGQCIGRWGNFVNQEAYGAAVHEAWQQFFPFAVFINRTGQWHYATFFYESLWCGIIVILLLTAERKHLFRRAGDIFFSYALLYGLERALVEGLRTDSLYLGPFRVSQLISLLLMLAMAATLFIRMKNARKQAAAMLAGCALTALLLTLGISAPALIPALCVPACWMAAIIKENKSTKAMIK